MRCCRGPNVPALPNSHATGRGLGGGARIGASGESRALAPRFVPLEDAWESPLGRPGGAASPGTGDQAAGSVTSGSRAPRLHSCGEEFLLLTLPSLLCSARTATTARAKAALSPGPGSAFGVLERVQQCRPAQRGGAGRGRHCCPRATWLPLTARSGPSQLGGSDLVRSRACQRLNPTPPVAHFPGLSFPLPPVPLLPIWAAPGLLHGFRGTEALPTAGASAPLPPRGPGWGRLCAARSEAAEPGQWQAPGTSGTHRGAGRGRPGTLLLGVGSDCRHHWAARWGAPSTADPRDGRSSRCP